MLTAPRAASSTTIVVAGSGASMTTSMPGNIARSSDGGFGIGRTSRTDYTGRVMATGASCVSADDTGGDISAVLADDTYVGAGYGVDGGTDRQRTAYTAVRSVEAGAAVQSVIFVFHRMRAVYRARGGFASRGSLNPVRPWP